MNLYCYIHKPTVVFRARANQPVFTYPLLTVDYDGVTTGSYSDIKPGMTIMFGSSIDASDLGRQRVKNADADSVTFAKSSRGSVDGTVAPVDDCYITVIDLYQVWAKIPYIADDGTMYKDDNITIGSGDYGTEIPPVANGGPGYAQFVDSITNEIEVDFDGSGSFAVTGTITDYEWDFVDGTPSTSTNATETVTFPPGFRYISLTVTSSEILENGLD